MEVVTNHRPRLFGQSKYGLSRTLRVVLDLLTVKFLLTYSTSPMKLFGMIGLACGGGASLAGLATLGMKFWSGVDMTGNPLLLLTALLAIVGVQFLSLGLLGEMTARLYFSRQERCHYTVRELLNIGDDAAQRPIRMTRRAA